MWKKGSDRLVIITGGEPAGIGSEIIVKTLHRLYTSAKIIVIGEKKAFDPFTDRINLIETLDKYKQGHINLINTGLCKKIRFGKPTEESSLAAIKALDIAISYAKKFKKVAIVTAPIYKAGIMSINGYKNFTGHTEYLAEAFKSDALMMFYGKKLKVATLTTHIPLRQVPDSINVEDIEKKVILAHSSLKKFFKISYPKIALLSLNPHAGENGKIGDEETKIITPALERIRKKKIKVFGPLPADSVFHRALKGAFDLIIGIYHDQVLGFFKALYFDSGVNVTLGLPIIRTSPDHGTAFDIAGKGIAKEKSFEKALTLAINLLYERKE